MYNTYKRIYNAGFACYALLAILAVIFYKERTIFTDTSFLLFQIIRTGAFAIQDMRFGVVLTALLFIILPVILFVGLY